MINQYHYLMATKFFLHHGTVNYLRSLFLCMKKKFSIGNFGQPSWAIKLKDKPVSVADDLDYYYSSWLEVLEELILNKEITPRDDFKREVLSQMKQLRNDHH